MCIRDSIEPEESNFDLLVENTSLYPNIIPLKAALWHENARISLTDPGMGKWGFRTEAVNIDKSTSLNFRESVTAITVDQLMKDYGLSKIDILKIDIEGAEKEVFSNTSKWITQVNSIIIELHDWMKQGCSRSFYCGTPDFDGEWQQGENMYLSKDNSIIKQ